MPRTAELSIEEKIQNWLGKEENQKYREPAERAGWITFRKIDGPHGYLSNMAPYGFTARGRRWRTVEHFFQAEKVSGFPDLVEKISQTPSPMMVKRIGRTRVHPATGETVLAADWSKRAEGVMRHGLYLKFLVNSGIRQQLLATGDAVLLEDSARDKHWAIGPQGEGMNRLGCLLMDVREELRREAAAASGKQA